MRKSNFKTIPDSNRRVEMNNHRVSVKLLGPDEDDGLVDLDALTGFCRSLSKCLKCVDSIVRPEKSTLHFRVVELQVSSAVVCVEPKVSDGEQQDSFEVVSFFKDTVARLQAGRVIDRRLSFEHLEAFRELAKPLFKRIKKVWVNGQQITKRFVSNIDQILENTITSQGQICGRLDTIYTHGRTDFVLFPQIGPSVTCSFPEDLFEQVRKALRRVVTVHGTLCFQPGQPFPHRVRVETLEVHPSNEKLPRLRDLRGKSKRCTGDLSSVAFVRAIRDE